MKIVRNFLWNSGYQLLIMILPLITAPYVSRVLKPEGIGINSFTSSVVQYFILVAALGTNIYGNREIAYCQNDKQRRSQIFWEINFLNWLVAGIVLVCFLVFVLLVHRYQEIYLIQGLLILSTFFDISWYFQGREKFKLIVIRNFIIKFFTIAAIFSFVRRPSDLMLYIFLMSLGTLLGSLSLWPYLKGEVFAPSLANVKLKSHLKNTLVLFFPAFIAQFYLVFNKILIGFLDSVVHVGFFSQADTIVRMGLTLVSSVGVVMLPRVSNMYSTGNREEVNWVLIKSFQISTGLAIPVYFGVSSIALKFAPFFFGTRFAEVGKLIMIEAPIIIFLVWSTIFGFQYLLPLKKMKTYTISAIVGAVASLVINLSLIPIFGVVGAMFSTVIAEFIVAAYQYYSVRKEFKLSILFNGIWKYVISGLVMFIVVFSMNQYFEMNVFQLFLQVVSGIVIYGILNIILKTYLWQVAQSLVQQFMGKK